MKHPLTIAMCSILLAACSQQSSTTINDAAQDVKDAAADTSTEVQAGATEAGDHAENLGSATKDGFYEATDHIADWMRPSKPKPPLPIAASYCYSVYQDILCYRQPMPGAEARLVAYQPLSAAPPPLVQTQLLPQRVADSSQQPVNRVAAAKPVFAQLPTPAANTDKTPEDGTTPAAASEVTHEQLPDPATAPQL